MRNLLVRLFHLRGFGCSTPAASALVFLVAFAGSACGSSEDSSADAAPTIDSAPAIDAATIDAAAAECVVQSDCPCFSNADCPQDFACTSLDDSGESVFCVKGPRGTGAAGETCVVEGDCASALCVEGAGGSFCSRLCTDANDNSCPAELPRCLFIGFGIDEFICAPAAT